MVIALQVDTYTPQALTTLDTCGQYQLAKYVNRTVTSKASYMCS